jgi:neutral trehalase
MLYTVEQSASQLNVSKATVYSKLKQNKFKGKTVTEQGQAMLSEALINQIKLELKVTKRDTQETATTKIDVEDIDSQETILKLNDKLYNALITQLEKKDNQIQELNQRLTQAQKLIENGQSLLQKPQQDLKLLEDHFNDLDGKLLNLKGKLDTPKENIFKRIFK